MLTDTLPYYPLSDLYGLGRRGSLLGNLELVTPPAAYPVTLLEAKAQCRLEPAFTAEDSLLNDLIASATEHAETLIEGHRQFMTATYDLPVRAFWWNGPLYIPRPPLQSVTSVKYYATDGTLTTSTATDYIVRTPWRGLGSIERAPNVTWPSVQCDREHPLVVRFVAGYASAALVPKAAKQAILLLIEHGYRYREPIAAGECTTATDLLNSLQWGSYA